MMATEFRCRENIKQPKHEVHIGIIGKYAEIEDAYASVKEACIHAGAKYATKVHRHWIQSEELEKDPDYLKKFQEREELQGEELLKPCKH